MPHTTQGLARKTTRSASWLYGQRMVTTVINLGVVAILSRQLEPAAFGLVALASVVMGMFATLGASSVSGYIIYDRKEGREERVQAAFWLNIALALATIVIFIIALPLVAYVYPEPLLRSVLLLQLVSFAFLQLRTVPDALIKRNLDFHKLVIRDTGLTLLTSGISVGLALNGWGVWSLVIPGVLVSPLQFLLVMYMARWKPCLPLRTEHWPTIFKYTRSIIGTDILSMINTEGDTLLIGKFLGSTALGFYYRAWTSANLVTKNIVSVVNSVATPSLSALQKAPDKLCEVYLRMLRFLAITAFPLLIGLFVMAEDFVLAIYGPRWEAAVLPLRILLIFAIRRAVGSPATAVFNALGRPDLSLKISIATLPFYLTAIVIGSRFGIVGVAIAVTLVKTTSGIVQMHISYRLLNIKFAAVFKNFWPPLECSLVMAAAVYGANHAIHSLLSASHWVALVVGVMIGAGTYLVLLLTRYTELLDQLLFALDSVSNALAKPVRLLLRRELKCTPFFRPEV